MKKSANLRKYSGGATLIHLFCIESVIDPNRPSSRPRAYMSTKKAVWLQVEQEMSKYGDVAGCSKDFIEVRGCRIENERRNVLFTAIVNKQAVINGELDMFGLFSSL